MQTPLETRPTKRKPILHELPSELTGERVLVRPFRPGDGAALWEAIEESREHLRPWMPWVDEHKTPDDSEAHARRSHARWLLREDMGVALWDKTTGRFVGGSGLHPYDWEVPSFEIGYWLRPSAVGNGYITETVQLLRDLAFATFAAERIFIRCNTENHRSAAVPKRLGFSHEATLRRDSRNPAGELRDTLVFGLTRADWQKSTEAGAA